jgi:hypothetical protein
VHEFFSLLDSWIANALLKIKGKEKKFLCPLLIFGAEGRI